MTRSVARAMGISLSDALRKGELAPETYSSMVTRCRACPLVGPCQAWLAKSHACRDTPPPGCANGSVFSAFTH
ncbi:MAG: hypothetical protein EP318_21455 [Rhodobacteraceae bacterium]|nr:MAG: hypothetical protein EP318_21455 [Paracoccaceae bacterium]